MSGSERFHHLTSGYIIVTSTQELQSDPIDIDERNQTMLSIIQEGYRDTLFMCEDFLRKVPDENWYTGSDDYLIPVRISYHIFMSFEWLTTRLPFEEHLKARRYGMNWEGPVKDMPSREAMLRDIEWVRGLLDGWFAELAECDPNGKESKERLENAVYYLRHIQHHIGELSILSRLYQFDCPEWK